jgi:hypothetical protein
LFVDRSYTKEKALIKFHIAYYLQLIFDRRTFWDVRGGIYPDIQCDQLYIKINSTEMESESFFTKQQCKFLCKNNLTPIFVHLGVFKPKNLYHNKYGAFWEHENNFIITRKKKKSQMGHVIQSSTYLDVNSNLPHIYQLLFTLVSLFRNQLKLEQYTPNLPINQLFSNFADKLKDNDRKILTYLNIIL